MIVFDPKDETSSDQCHRPRHLNSTVGALRMAAGEARNAGGISVAHSASFGFMSPIETKLAKRAT
jgi:hypothetical protein